MMIAKPENVRVESLLQSARVGRKGWLSGTALAGRAGVAALGAAGLIAAAGMAQANPVGGQVVAGHADIVQSSPSQLDIVQSTKKAIINWGQFSIDEGETTNFIQPNSKSITLNRVTGGDPSQILGNLTANGNVILLNQNGILFGQNSKVDVGGLVASTANISNENFLADNFRFEGAPQGSWVVNQGRITVREGGLAALVAPGVENSGVIEAKLGSVSLASGTAFTVDLYGDGLVSLAVGGRVTESVTGPDGHEMAALVTNDGTVVADGGTVLITADAAAGVVDSVINMGGVVEAKGFGQDSSGAIVLDGGDHGIVAVSGTLDATGASAGQNGGAITVTGELVALRTGADLDASGASGGGRVKVGGDYQGKGATPTARRTVVEDGASLSADALNEGDGGRVVVWADENTIFSGHLSAKGGARAATAASPKSRARRTWSIAARSISPQPPARPAPSCSTRNSSSSRPAASATSSPRTNSARSRPAPSPSIRRRSRGCSMSERRCSFRPTPTSPCSTTSSAPAPATSPWTPGAASRSPPISASPEAT